MDILILKERIKNTILLGESQFREFKSAYAGEITKTNRGFKEIAEDISKTLVAFANADGGELLIGVEDDGVITGCDLGAKTVDKLLQVPKTHIHQDTPLQNYKALQIEIDSKEILYFSIEKSLNIHQTSDGKCLQRRDLESIPVSFKQLHIERTEQVSREYDRQYVFGANVTDLDIPLLKHVGEVIAKGMSVEKVLQYLDLADYKDSTLILRRAALLLFGNDIIKWHPRSEVRILRIRGTELYTGRDYNVKNDEKSYGNIIKLMTTGWESLRPHLVDTKFHADGLFRERIMYPEDACREALTNAIAHRDY
jgi:ATP-dependent DNA helicase RecG